MNGNAWRKARKRAGLPEVRVHDIKQVVGSAATLDALRWGEVNILVMANDYQPDPGWTCTVCQSIGTETPETLVCPHCGH
jgi:rubrerythrin